MHDNADAAPESELEGHSTTGVCWDGAVVLADLLCHAPAVLISLSANLARSPAAYKEWKWAGKVVVELGCGTSALPSCAAALHSPRAVVCTDGNSNALTIAAANIARWGQEHGHAGDGTRATTLPVVAQLKWGASAEEGVMASMGLSAPADVILAADCVYVLDNPGGWGKLLATITALSAPHTLAFITYTERGHDKMWKRFVAQRVEQLFQVVEVPAHLLHPYAHAGAVGRLEQLTPRVQVYCWSRRPPSKLHSKLQSSLSQ